MHKLIIHWVHLDINVQLFIPIHSLVHSLSYLTFLLAHSRSNTLTHSSSLSQTLSLKHSHSNLLTRTHSLSQTRSLKLTLSNSHWLTYTLTHSNLLTENDRAYDHVYENT